MSLRFIIGRAGSGKTRQCLAEIKQHQQQKPEKPLVYLVPEQATFHMEKNLLEFCGLDGTMQVHVLSFQRLAWRVLQETGGGIYPVLDKVGKALILRRILEKNRKQMKAFARVMDTPGFLEKLAEVMAEFKAYNTTPGKFVSCLESLAGPKEDALRGRLEDLVLVYSEYEDYLANKYLDTEDLLRKLARKVPLSVFLDGAGIWLDGFHGFTPQEYKVIREILLKTSGVSITLCLDREHLNKSLTETDTFYPPWETWRKLVEISRETGCREEYLFLDYGMAHRFSRREELAHLEKSFFEAVAPFAGEAAGLKLTAAANRRAELEGTAQRILNLCREKGLRFQDIAVLFRDISPYESLLPAVFNDYGIPYFLDKKRPLRHHPLLDLLEGALEVVESGWNHEPLFRCLKTDLLPVSRREVDLLENYCLSHGIRGSRWTDGKPWGYMRRCTLEEEYRQEEAGTASEEETELKRINRAREKAIPALGRLEAGLRKARTARDFAVSIYNLLEELAAACKLQYWSRKAEEEGELEEAQLHSQVWQKVMELLEQFVQVLGEQEINVREFSRVLKSGLESIELGLIPPRLDQVLVGTLDRSRNPDLKAVFVLGANEGVLPKRISEEGFFSDDEKEILGKMRVELAPTSEKRLFAEQFLVYLALTRASDFLQVSFPASDEEGRALSPSFLFEHLGRIFPSARESNGWPGGQAKEVTDMALDCLVNPRPVMGCLGANLRRAADGEPVEPLWWDVYNWFLNEKEWQKPLALVVNGLSQANREERLPLPLVRRLYGSSLLTSISRLERFKACPFSYFLNYGLKLKEREEYKLKALDLGRFFHAAIERAYRRLEGEGLDLAGLDEHRLSGLVESTVDEIVPQLQNELLLSTSRYRFLTRKFRRTVTRALRVLREHELRGTFRPVGLEMSFGPEGRLPGLRLKLASGGTIVLQGRIDRVDAARGENGYYLRVIDYKSGNPTLSLMEIFYGLKIQLVAYLDVVMTHARELIGEEALPAGVFYFTIQDPIVAGDKPLERGEIESRILKELRMKGYLLKDPQAIMLMDSSINGRSELIPAAMKKNGELYKDSGCLLTRDEFSSLRLHVENLLTEIGEEIMAGEISIQPYRYKGSSPCAYCSYQAVCRFDPAVAGETYRVLPVREPGEIWRELGIRKEAVDNG
ncbi:MAG: helicase-exonuclease AddAB subunit AddB [Peptococcaceae bacterium]|nr:helicase-exonuclease AddAB subunit AddB [Peptococcaceae bacterium]MDH7524839.1 helicase-exonuclease AddAB subunit AddB [Peptococcaceae bacterium]